MMTGLVFLASGCLINWDLYERRMSEIVDTDQDGFRDATEGGDDCDDENALVHPGADEVPYDSLDQDCDGQDLRDVDGDGFEGGDVGGADCDDADAGIFPEAPDDCYDGVDADCAADDDDDCDGDGHTASAAGGADCDDADPEIHPGSDDACYDGIDADCAGDDDNDCDRDLHAAESAGGDDCDDTDPATFPGATESWGDSFVDNDCDLRLDDAVASDPATVGIEIAPPSGTQGFGTALGTLADRDGDEQSEVWVCAPDDGGGSGSVFLIESASLTGDSSLQLDSAILRGDSTAALGSGLATADLDDDGEEELVVGALGADGGAGAAYVIPTATLAPESTVDSAAALVRGGTATWLGSEVHVGDLDTDGVDDLIVTAAGTGVFVWLSPGVADLDSASADVVWYPQSGSYLTVDLPGDVDGDGRIDVGLEQGLTDDGQPGAALLMDPLSDSATFPADPPFSSSARPSSARTSPRRGQTTC